jgi:hypothetical protein
VITPAISVLSAVEGLKIGAPRLAPMAVPVTIAVLAGLFLIRRKGTGFIGNIFGPVMLTRFVAISEPGLLGIMRAPGIPAAISPHHAVLYLIHAGPGLACREPGFHGIDPHNITYYLRPRPHMTRTGQRWAPSHQPMFLDHK